jgi:HD-GYP domain-containing protein (c-di-GMP phosphodiesterase class II)
MVVMEHGPRRLHESTHFRDTSDGSVRLSEVLAGLSYALDLTEGQRPGHSVRSCLIGMRIAGEIGLGPDDLSSLFYALLMKDLGCSSNAARFAALFGSNDHDLKADLKSIDWSRALESFQFVARNAAPGHSWLRRVWRVLAVLSRGPEGAREVVRTRCERGADIARLLELSTPTVEAIRALDEHWDGNGQPYATKREAIPLLGRILGLAQTVEVFFSTYGVESAYQMARARRGTWFDPALVDALFAFRADLLFWQDVGAGGSVQDLKFIEPADRVLLATEEKLDLVAEAFARVIDAKSPWTYQHSNGVAEIAVAIGRTMGFSAKELRELRQASLLHDLGKLGVSNLILDKPGKLTDAELRTIRRHPEHTASILARVSCFNHLAEMAASHHERLDGRGYHRSLRAAQLTQHARVLCVADICDALRSSRPYRPGMKPEQLIDVMSREAGGGIDPDCFAAMRSVLADETTPAKIEVPIARLVPSLAEDYVQAA